ncbi:MAG: phosphatidylinositol-specific phospholipase C1-like protein, partial [Actinomycetota bacterium]
MNQRWARVVLVVVTALLAAGLSGRAASAGPPPDVEGLPGDLRLNQVQMIGSHNSYHLEPREPLASAIRLFDPAGLEQIQYSHSPLPTQFGSEFVRQIELDVFADSVGGRYATPVGGEVNGDDPADRPEMFEPGMKVLHIQDIDHETTCTTLVRCLTQAEQWSDANPDHSPIAVLIETKDSPIPDPTGLGFVVPEPFTADRLDELDAEIRSVLDPGDLITPDDVRGGAVTLEQAVLSTGWPTLADSRGKFIFLYNNGGQDRVRYLTGHPSLAGRVMFTNASPGDDDAAFVMRNDPGTGNAAQASAAASEIQNLVAAGYVVRTRSDVPTFQARSGDTARRDQALASGAQWVSTDYPVQNRALNRFGTDYYAALPEGNPIRCNPV